MLFSNSSPKTGISGPKFRLFYLLCIMLQIGELEGSNFKYHYNFVKFQPSKIPTLDSFCEKYPTRHVQCQIYSFLFFYEILQSEKFEGAIFKYDNIVSKFQSRNTQNKQFQSQIQAFFRQVFLIDKFQDADFKYDNSFLKFQSKNTQIRQFLVPN